MKLSEMSTREMARAMADIAKPVENITMSNGFSLLMKEWQGGGINKAQLVLRLGPMLLSDCYGDTLAVLSALTGKTVEALNAQKGVETIKDITECLDADLMAFFS